MKLFCNLHTRVTIVASVVSVAATWAVAAPTATATASLPPVETTDPMRTSVALNLLSGPRASQPRVHVRSLGTGRWVCSPAGSGQRSRCYRN